MSLYSNSLSIGGVPCGLVMRGAQNGQYLAVFERSQVSLDQIEGINWAAPEISGSCILPAGYGYTVEDIQYDMATKSYRVTLQVASQYMGDVSGYQAQVAELEDTVAQQAATIQGQETALAERDATIEEQAAAIEAMEAAGTADGIRAELQAAYAEGVESNG